MTAPRILPAEHNDRVTRVLSAPCPACGAPAGRRCATPAGHPQGHAHAARWDAWYAAHPQDGEQR